MVVRLGRQVLVVSYIVTMLLTVGNIILYGKREGVVARELDSVKLAMKEWCSGPVYHH